jgi:hypothetical protein
LKTGQTSSCVNWRKRSKCRMVKTRQRGQMHVA